MTPPRSLIVGPTGQVGGALTRILGSHSIPAGRLPTGDGIPFLDLVALAHNSQCASQVLAPLALDAVYCVGGATDVERCESDIDWAMDTNCYGPAALAAASRDLAFVYFSTEYVFDGRESPGHPAGPYSETDATNPISVYGRSKLAGERRILDVHPRPLIIRTTVVYGYDRRRKNFLYALSRLISSKQTMRVPVDQISSPTYNQDLAAATVELVSLGASGIFNVCGPECFSRYDFALIAAKVLGLDTSLIAPVTTAELNQRAPRPLKAGMKTDKLHAVLRHTRMHPNHEAIAAWAEDETFAQRGTA